MGQPASLKQGSEKAVQMPLSFLKVLSSTYFSRLNPLKGILSLFRNELGP